jgi:sRNA-binding regulator protein Hfq
MSVSGGAMKDTIPAVPVERHFEQEGFGNRKLIRPLMNHTNHSAINHAGPGHSAAGIGERRERPERPERGGERSNGARKSAPPEQTNAENFYFQKQMQSKTPMVIVMLDDEEVHGIIEWYDRACIKVNRTGAPNLMIYKPSIKYMYKEAEGRK